MGDALYNRINAAASPDELVNLERTIWYEWGQRQLGDDEAQFLAEAAYKRKPQRRPIMMAQGLATASRISRFKSRQHPRSPDRKASRDRRRMFGSSSMMPPALRAKFTEGQRAVLAIVHGEIKHHGICDLNYDKIAALAGVCRTTVQTTMHEARRLCLINIAERPRTGMKNLTNVIRIVSLEWLTWLARGPAAHRPGGIGSNSVKIVSPTKSTDSRKEEAFQRKQGKRTRQPPKPPTGNGYAVIAARLTYGQSLEEVLQPRSESTQQRSSGGYARFAVRLGHGRDPFG
jgi:hypothetical protein